MSYTKDDACRDIGILLKRVVFFVGNLDPLHIKKKICAIINRIDSFPSSTIGNVASVTPTTPTGTPGYSDAGDAHLYNISVWAYKTGSPNLVSATSAVGTSNGNMIGFGDNKNLAATWTAVTGASGYFVKVYYNSNDFAGFIIDNKYYDNGNSTTFLDTGNKVYLNSPPYP